MTQVPQRQYAEIISDLGAFDARRYDSEAFLTVCGAALQHSFV
jgi:hypothetical protein